MRRVLEMERLRTRIASDLHDDLGSSLTQIAILSDVIRSRLGSPAAAVADPLARIGALSRESVDSMSDIVWAIDPLRDTPMHLVQRMRRVADETLVTHEIQLQFESTGDTGARLKADVRRHLFLIFKEILHNIVRHANATHVTVQVVVTPRQVLLTAIDDGTGFDTTAVAGGQGLRSMKRRAANLRGSVDVVSAPTEGTRVSVTIPVR